ncbi:MAG: hypothetical protein LBM93_04720, partial [Oscillospiraceae bacterium]|nr:hypothetical protein [Oscillospiraceae bacterium]
MKYNDYFEKIIEEYSDKITNRKKGVVIWGNTDIGACLAEYCLKNKIPVFAIIDKRTEEFVPITYRSGLSSVEVVNVPVMQYENFLSDDSLFIVIAANQASNEIVSIVQKNNWQYLVLHDYIDIQNNTNPEIILRRYKEQRNLVNVLYSFQEYQSDLIVDGIYRNALVV